jgi:hypothetical protein
MLSVLAVLAVVTTMRWRDVPPASSDERSALAGRRILIAANYFNMEAVFDVHTTEVRALRRIKRFLLCAL